MRVGTMASGVFAVMNSFQVRIRAREGASWFTEGEDFVIREYQGANHNEASWRARIDDPLLFMFGREESK